MSVERIGRGGASLRPGGTPRAPGGGELGEQGDVQVLGARGAAIMNTSRLGSASPKSTPPRCARTPPRPASRPTTCRRDGHSHLHAVRRPPPRACAPRPRTPAVGEAACGPGGRPSGRWRRHGWRRRGRGPRDSSVDHVVDGDVLRVPPWRRRGVLGCGRGRGRCARRGAAATGRREGMRVPGRAGAAAPQVTASASAVASSTATGAVLRRQVAGQGAVARPTVLATRIGGGWACTPGRRRPAARRRVRG